MLFGETLSQKHIVDWSRKGYVNDAIGVKVSDLCCPKQEFLPAKAMGVNRDSRPTRDYAFERLHVLHLDPRPPARAGRVARASPMRRRRDSGSTGAPTPR